jgi:hypothetical protein
LLTIGVVGAVVLTRRPKGELEPLPDDDPPAIYQDDTTNLNVEVTEEEHSDTTEDLKLNELEIEAPDETEVSSE